MLVGPLQKAEINVMRKEESDVLIAQVLPYGASLSSTGSPGLGLGGWRVEGGCTLRDYSVKFTLATAH